MAESVAPCRPKAATTVGLMLPTVAVGPRPVLANQVLEAARRAEAAGYDCVYAGDHLVYPHPVLECVVSLAAVAAVTRHVGIGSCVLLIALRQPLVLARQLAAVAAFAPGRLRVGVGVGGEVPAEFTRADVSIGERGALTAAAVRELRALLAGHDHDAVAAEAPGGTPAGELSLPFFFGGSSQVALRRAAELGDGWVGYLHSPASFARRRSYLLAHRERCRLGGAAFSTGMVLPVHLGSAGRIPGDTGIPPQRLVAGPVSQVLDTLASYRQAGCTELVLRLLDDGPRYLDQLDTIAARILPPLQAL
jgi:alkanesulfonate monooxygenase SsuD/methylene tetrahydromethanopterin reductase-like flavin-dependent oxidoreductase (luciferase family)